MPDSPFSPFEERFELLVASGQANARSVAAAKLALGMVEQDYQIRLSEELGASLASHIAITVKRLLDGETLCGLPEEVWEEIREYRHEMELAASIAAELRQNLNIPIEWDEQGFIAVHLCKIKIECGATERKSI
ncbi:MAG: PRD domain-containing protein [Chloroflexi bacterium]|nr:PRD domain-containing protein [Chloroflexota bacterium]